MSAPSTLFDIDENALWRGRGIHDMGTTFDISLDNYKDRVIEIIIRKSHHYDLFLPNCRKVIIFGISCMYEYNNLGSV